MHRLLFCFLFISTCVFSQTSIDKTSFDFGTLLRHSERFVDFYITNNGAKKAYLLRVDKPKEVTSISKGDAIIAGDTIIVRFQVNPKEEGPFNYKVDVYVSDKMNPITLRLSGNIKELDLASALQACPDFSRNPQKATSTDFDLTVVTVEKGSGIPLSKSVVSFVQNGSLIGQWKTNKDGNIQQKGSIGYLYFYGRHTGYFPAEKGTYINPENNYVVLELTRNPAETIPEVIPDPILPKVDTTELIAEVKPEKDTVTIAEIKEEPIIPIFQNIDSTELKDVPPELANIPMEEFDEKYFKPNNIVFVLDISMSMNTGDRMELMKYALNELAGYIRPQDNISIVTYASYTNVILSNASGKDVDKIKKIIHDLKGGGFTAGGAGIKLGYKQARSGYIENGNNEIIVVTDGAFNRESEDYKKEMKKYKKKGYILSVVGIKNNPKDEDEMRGVAELGNGRYIPIFKLEDAKWNLIQEIRKASFK